MSYTDVEAYTQGVEIRDISRRRFISRLPVVSSGKDDLSLDTGVVGQRGFYETYEPFLDKKGRLTAEEVVSNPRLYDRDAQTDSSDFISDSGVIDPLAVRYSASFVSAEGLPARGVRGDLNTSVNRKPSPLISNVFDVTARSGVNNAFFDAQDVVLSIPIPGYSGTSDIEVTPFDDASVDASGIVRDKFFRQGSEFGNTRKSAATGFTYSNSRYGLDSVAFGGLTR